MWLIISGPFRAAWQRSEPQAASWGRQLPMLLSLTFMLALFTFFTVIAYPLTNPHFWGGMPPSLAELVQEMGIVSLLLDAALLVGAVLITIRRWTLPSGALTFVFALNGLAMSLLYDGHLPLGYIVLQAAATMAPAGLVANWLLA